VTLVLRAVVVTVVVSAIATMAFTLVALAAATAVVLAGAAVTLPFVAVAVVAVVVLVGVVVSPVSVSVAGVAEPLAVSVVFVAVPMLVGVVILRPPRVMTMVVVLVSGRTVRIGLLADSRLRGRGDPAAARALRRSDRRAGGETRGRSSADRTGPIGRRCASALGGRGGATGGPRGHRCVDRRCDGRADLAGSGGRRRNRRLLAGQVEKARRCQNEADRSQDGEQADYGCGYARKTAPH
jgi:hypothetical protein